VRYDIESALLASERAAAVTLWNMGRGRRVLAAIASTAGWVGLIETAREVPYLPLFGCCGECACWPASAFFPGAMGLVVAIPAYFALRYLCARLEAVKTEMRVASLELANLLSLRQRN